MRWKYEKTTDRNRHLPGDSGGCGIFFLLAVIRLDAYTRKLPYYILSVQPVVAEDKTGVFTKLGYFLNKKLEGRQEHEKI